MAKRKLDTVALMEGLEIVREFFLMQAAFQMVAYDQQAYYRVCKALGVFETCIANMLDTEVSCPDALLERIHAHAERLEDIMQATVSSTEIPVTVAKTAN